MCLQNTPTSPSPPTPVSPPHASFSSSTHLCRQSVSSSPSFTAAVHSLGSGGRYTWGKKKQSTHLQACSRLFFFFFALHDRGRKWNTGMGGKKSGLAFLFFLLMMLLCTIVASTCCLFPAVCCSLNLAAVILAYFCGHGCSQALRCNYHCCRVEKGGGIFPEHFLFIHFLFFCVAPCAAV